MMLHFMPFAFLVSLLLSILSVHLRSETNEFGYIIIFVFHQIGFVFVHEGHIVRVFRQIITHVESSDIEFRDFVNILILDMVYRTVRVGVYIILHLLRNMW